MERCPLGKVPLPAQTYLDSIVVLAPNNVWAFGSSPSIFDDMPHPVVADGGPNVTAVSPSNVWLGWEDTTNSYAPHWDRHQ
ncbi:MAG TPA: hypothetical protein VHZ03_13705 [Trebonia sp.]|nr:hypothetical protein [Trebonia sp.]